MTVEEALKLPVESILKVGGEHIIVVKIPRSEDPDEVKELLDEELPADTQVLVTHCDLDIELLKLDDAQELFVSLKDILDEE
ncbi:MAG: hypothetical protein WC824_07985 [Bacteroidota bacterium]|jgi:hypothetical protein